MKKIILLLSLASIFVGYVMFRLMGEGVTLQERRMIKWSDVESAEKTGVVVARHIYPLLKEQQEFFIQGQSDFAQGFKKSFLQTAQAEGLKTIFHTEIIPRGYKGMILAITELSDHPNEELCKKNNRKECLKIKAIHRFTKKERPPNKLWIQMWRVSKNELQLFYKNNK